MNIGVIAGNDADLDVGLSVDQKVFNTFKVKTKLCSSFYSRQKYSSEIIAARNFGNSVKTLSKCGYIKIGALYDDKQVDTIINYTRNAIKIWDPIFYSSSGVRVSKISKKGALRLCKFVDVITPNYEEFEFLFGKLNGTDTEKIARINLVRREFGLTAIVVTGGDKRNELCVDYLVSEGSQVSLASPSLNINSRGTGCRFSSLLCVFLSQGIDVESCALFAKAQLYKWLEFELSNIYYWNLPTLPLNLQGCDMVSIYINGLKLNLAHVEREISSLGVYLIASNIDEFIKASEWGADTIQYRVKCFQSLKQELSVIVSIARQYNVRLILNDFFDLALEKGVDGLHLGHEDLHNIDLLKLSKFEKNLGLSTHSIFELKVALTFNPTYIAIGPVFETTCKVMRFAPQGFEKVRKWREQISTNIRLVAIGGINNENIAKWYIASKDSVCVKSGIWEASSPKSAFDRLKACLGN